MGLKKKENTWYARRREKEKRSLKQVENAKQTNDQTLNRISEG